MLMASKWRPFVATFLCLSTIVCESAAACPLSGSLGRRLLKEAGPALQFGFYDSSCPSLDQVVLALAAVHSVRMAGGPTFAIDLGRRDGLNSYAATATSSAPLSTFKVDALVASFANAGLDQTDLVALSGIALRLLFEKKNVLVCLVKVKCHSSSRL